VICVNYKVFQEEGESSNTAHLSEIPTVRGLPSYYINEAGCIHADNTIRHRAVSGLVMEGDVLLKIREEEKKDPKLQIGIASGVSTPDKEVQDAFGKFILLNKL